MTAPTVLFVGTSFLSQIGLAMDTLSDAHNVLVDIPLGVTDYTNISLYNWRDAYSDLLDTYYPDVVVAHINFPAAPDCHRLTTAADTEMCVELNRERYLYPVVDDMMKFFADRKVAAVFVGMPATGLGDGVIRDAGLHKEANELTRSLNASLRERVTGSGFAFFDPAEVLGTTYAAYRQVGGGWEQWQFGRGDIHLCPPAAAAVAGKLNELILGETPPITRTNFEQLWARTQQKGEPCVRGLLTADQLAREGLLTEHRPVWR